MSKKIAELKLMPRSKRFAVLPDEFSNEATIELGSEFKTVEGKVANDTHRGLTPEQERILLPDMIGMDCNNPNWNKSVREFWSKWTFPLTAEGRKLNYDSVVKEMVDPLTKEKVKIEVPINLQDYIDYNMAKQSCRVAKTDDERENVDYFDGVLVDVAEQVQVDKSKFAKKQAATKQFLVLQRDASEELIEQLLDTMGPENEDFSVLSDKEEKIMALEKYVLSDPEKFLRLHEDKDLEIKALLRRLVKAGIIYQEQDIYFIKDDNTVIGREALAIEKFRDPQYSKNVVLFKSRLAKSKEKLKN